MGDIFGSSNNTSTSTTSPTWGTEYLRDLVSRADDVSRQPFQPYYGETVAPLSDQQNMSIWQLGQMFGQGVPFFNSASGSYGQSANAANAAEFAASPYMINASNYLNAGAMPMTQANFSSASLEGLMNPYRESVIDSTMKVLDENNQAQANRLAGRSISGGSFGGDRSGVAQAELARQQNLGRDQTIAGLNSSMFDNAQKLQFGILDSNAKRALQAANTEGSLGQLALSSKMQPAEMYARIAAGQAGLGSTYQNSLIKGATAGLQAGTIEQNVRQAFNNSAYQQFMRGESYPRDQLSWLAGILNGATGQSRTTTTESPGPSGTSQAIGLGLTALSLLGGGNASTGASNVGSWLSSWFADGGVVDGSRAGFLTGGGVDGEEDDEPAAMNMAQIATPFGGLGADGLGALADLARTAPKVAAAQPAKPVAPPPAAQAAAPAAAPAAPAPAAPASAAPAAASAPTKDGAPPSGDFRNAMLTAGLAMMAGQSPHAMTNIGNAGLAGLQAYKQSQSDAQARAAATAEMALKKESAARDQQRIDLQAKALLAQIEEQRLSRSRQEKLDAIEIPHKEALTKKALAEANRNPFVDRAAQAQAVGLSPGSPGYQEFVLTGKMPAAVAAKATPQEQARARSEQRRLDDLEKSADVAADGLSALDRIVELRKQATATGPWLGRAAAAAGFNQDLEAETTRLWAESAKLLPGALSNKEGARLDMMVPGSRMSDEAATRVIAARRAAFARAEQRAIFMQEWMGTHGSLSGAREAWNRFTEEKPALTWSPNGDVSVNGANIENWQPYLSKSKRGSDGAPSKAGTPQPAPRIKTKAEFDQLPSGAEFVAPDGSLRRKN